MFQSIAPGDLIVNDQPSPSQKEESGMETWGQRCLKSIRKEKAEVERRYGIKIGQTDIYCARCGRPWGFGGHTCMDVRLQKLREEKRVGPGHLKNLGSKMDKEDVSLKFYDMSCKSR